MDGLDMKKHMVWGLLLSIMLVIAGCGNHTGGNNSGNSSTTGSNSSSNEQLTEGSNNTQSNEDAKFPRTYSAANGDIVIEKAPEKVAVVHWGYTDSILLFDVPSLALVAPFGRENNAMGSEEYKPYVDKLKDWSYVGDSTEVNLEELMAYGPDLIIAGNQTNEKAVEQLEKIATTVVIDEAKINVWSDWKPVVTAFGDILGQEETAEQFITHFDKVVSETKQSLANVEGTAAFLQVRDNTIWLQGKNYLSLYYDQLGLTAPEGDASGDGAQLSLEGLSEIDADHLVLGYFNYFNKSLAALTDEWEETNVWKQLKAVEAGHVYGINGEMALAYGPLSHLYGVKAVGDALR